MTGFTDPTINAAVAAAREALGLDVQVPARTWSVARIQPGAQGYLLVVFGAPEHASGMAAVDPTSGRVLESASLPGREPHRLLSADEAIARAGFGPGTQARLVWDPSGASRSPFYPLWQLQNAERTIWVDSVRGTVWPTVDVRRGGGAGQT